MAKSIALWNQKRRGLSITRLMARDGMACQICGRPLDRRESEPWRNPRAISFDHIVPRSAGGLSDLRNLRLTHRSCNMQRGNDPLVEDGDAEMAVARTAPLTDREVSR